MNTLDYQTLHELIDKDMPLLPGPVLHILRLLGDDTVSTSAIANSIGHDPGLATRILRVANSPLFNTGRPTTSLKTAVLSLGQQNLYKMVVLMSVADLFANDNFSTVLEDKIWKHSLAVGYSAREIMVMKRQKGHEEAFLAGILHDIGKLLLFRHNPSLYRLINQDDLISDYELIKRELSTYGFTHAQLGWMAAARWDLPITLSEAIACHHFAANEIPDSILPLAIESADFLSSYIGFGIHTPKQPDHLLEDLFILLAAKLSLSLTQVKFIATSLESNMRWLTKLF